MTLSAGTRLGSYEVVAPIGAGGMGEVYRAKDTKLGRNVALKVLPESFADNADRMARFEREAQVLASLNHPNIAAIYGLEESSSARALVMELVAGPTLAERVGGRAMPLDEALPIAQQIADALEYAHERGIIHRDLKPANIKLTADGKVKVLDFGLAKAMEPPTPATTGNPSISPTLTIEGTRTGVILGTAAYMAPEQARGAAVDKRADIWAFGVVLYEMLTGRQPFAGATVSDTLAAVLKTEPEFTKLPIRTYRLVRRCLEKDPKHRLRDIGDAQYLLDEAGRQAEARTRSRVSWAVAGVFAVALAVVLWAPWRRPPISNKPLVRLDVDLGPDVSLNSNGGPDVILSPDGTRMLYVSHDRLFTRRLDQEQATELPGTEGARAPFFSPDGQSVAFFGRGKLKKISVAGGATTVIQNAPGGTGGSWGEDGAIIAALNVSGGLSHIPPDGSALSPLTQLDRAQREATHRWPQILPGGKAALFTSNSRSAGGFDEASIQVVSLVDHDHPKKTLLRGATYARYLTSGHLLYMNRGSLFAVPFDLSALKILGSPTSVVGQVAYNVFTGVAQFDVSQTGTLVYGVGSGQQLSVSMQWLERDGKTRPIVPRPGEYGRPSFSPDGRRLAMDIADGSSEDIWIYDLGRDAMTRLTFDGKLNQFPIWSPDGQYIVFQDLEGLSWTRANGAGKPQPLLRTKSTMVQPWSFAPDGKRLAYFELDPGTAFHLWTVSLQSTEAGLRAGKPEVVLQTAADERHPAFSPDGRWLAYSSTESGSFQVYVRAFPDKGGKWQISNDGGTYPTWSHNGRDLFFESLDNRIMVAGYTVQRDSFVPDKPRIWSEKRLANLGGLFKNFDLAPDGTRIAALIPVENDETQKARNHVVFLQNFFDELSRRVPISR